MSEVNIQAMRKLISDKQEFPKRFVKQMLEEITTLRRDVSLLSKALDKVKTT